MARNIILIILGSIILNIAISVFIMQRVKVKISNYMWKLMEGNYISEITIKHNQRFLNLADEQVDMMLLIDKKYNDLEESYRNKYNVYMKEMRGSIFLDYFNEEKIREQLSHMDNENREIRILNLKEIYELEKILNQEQKEKFRNYLRQINTRKGKFALPWNMF
jgi:Spy/CpxP family protein refolding chaperone